MTSVEPLAPSQLLEVYKKARLINLFDERMRSLLRSGKLMAVYYSPRGQEIVASAMGVHLKSTDYLVTMYRGIHDQLAKGMPLRELCAPQRERRTYRDRAGGRVWAVASSRTSAGPACRPESPRYRRSCSQTVRAAGQ